MNAAVGFPSIALHNLPPRKRLAAQLRFDKATVASASGVTTRRSRRRRDAETRAAEARASLAKNITGIRRARGRENDDDGFLNEGLAQRAKRALGSMVADVIDPQHVGTGIELDHDSDEEGAASGEED